jgi:hypothetical protein
MTNNDAVRGPGRRFVAGYAALLVQIPWKNRLRDLRDRLGLPRTSQVERCLATAAISIALDDPSLLSRLLARFETATEEDSVVTKEHPSRGSAGPPPSPGSGTVNRKRGWRDFLPKEKRRCNTQ